MPRWLNALIIGLATGLIGVVIVLTPIGADFEKDVGLTWLFKVRGAIEPPADVVVVAINEQAASGLGLPELPRDWPRNVHGWLINSLVKRGARVITFDMDFQRAKSDQDDDEFARAVAASQRVVIFTRLDGKRQPVFDVNGREAGTIWSEELIPPVPVLADSAKALAPFPVPKVQVNVFQFWAFKPSIGDIATMPVAALQIYLGNVYPQWLDLLTRAGVEGIEQLPRQWQDVKNAQTLMNTMRRAFNNDPELADRIRSLLNTQPETAADSSQRRSLEILTRLYEGPDNRYLNFYGPPGSIRTIPYNRVITSQDTGSDLDFTGKAVFVGLSDLYDPGQPDRFFTVFTRDDGVDLSGVEIAATAFANLSTDRTVTPADPILMTAILMLFGIVIGIVVYLLPAMFGAPLALLLGGGYFAGMQLTFNTADLWLPLATPLLVQLPLALFTGLLAQYLLGRRRGLRLSKAVSYYLPEKVARELTEKELDPSALDKLVYGVCLATDMAGFTTISENMAPDKLAAFMNDYFDALADALKRHHVDVTEFRADSIMCCWAADNPESMEHRHPVLASLAVVDAVSQFSAKVGASLYSRVGLEEGWFYLGHQGGGGRMGYSIVGDCANTASRHESLNKHLGTHILTSQSIVDAAGVPPLLVRPLGQFILVGKTEPTQLVEILARKELASERQTELCLRFTEALDALKQSRLAQACELFEAILQDYPDDGPSRFHLSRCRTLQNQESPSQQLDVVLMDSK